MRDTKSGEAPDCPSLRRGALAPHRLGARNIPCPIVLPDREGHPTHTVATVDMWVESSPCKADRGQARHSAPGSSDRMARIADRFRDESLFEATEGVLRDIVGAFDAVAAQVEVAFPFFVVKKAPVSGAESIMNYPCRLVAGAAPNFHLTQEVGVPITLLHAVQGSGKNGARNQRGLVTVAARFSSPIPFEEIIALVENSASCELYSLLKRPDEKHVTLKAYRNPMSLEELIRRVAEGLLSRGDVLSFRVEGESLDSVHSHNTYASLHWSGKAKE